MLECCINGMAPSTGRLHLLIQSWADPAFVELGCRGQARKLNVWLALWGGNDRNKTTWLKKKITFRVEALPKVSACSRRCQKKRRTHREDDRSLWRQHAVAWITVDCHRYRRCCNTMLWTHDRNHSDSGPLGSERLRMLNQVDSDRKEPAECKACPLKTSRRQCCSWK